MRKVRLLVALSLVVLMLAGAALVSAQGDNSITIDLTAQNDSGENGTATLTDLGNGKTKVVVDVTGAPAGVAQPLHIHEGTCANLTASPTYPLTSAMDGKSETEIDATLASLQNGNFAINGHKSAEEASIYVFCGDIPASATAAATLPATGADFTSSLLMLAALGTLIVLAGVFVMRRAPRSL